MTKRSPKDGKSRGGKRTYAQHCALARGLDVVGERWTLLIVRELLCGPRRYSDLLANLPGIGTNLLAARLQPRIERPLRAYASLEVVVGGCALLSLPLLANLHQVYAWLGVPDGDTGLTLSRILLAALVLLPPTIAMGATVPVVARGVVDRDEVRGRWSAILYAANTLGAVLGAQDDHLVGHVLRRQARQDLAGREEGEGDEEREEAAHGARVRGGGSLAPRRAAEDRSPGLREGPGRFV